MFPLLFASVLWSVLIYAVLFLVMVFAVEAESGVWAAMFLAASIFCVSWIGHVNPLSYIEAHPVGIITTLLIYLGVGTIWSVVKWALHVHTKVGEYNDYKSEYMHNHHLTELTPEAAARIADYKSPRPPNARDNKTRIIRWMTYWPFSIIGSIFNDLIKKIYQHVYELLQSTYQSISNSIFKGLSTDAEMADRYRDEKNKPRTSIINRM